MDQTPETPVSNTRWTRRRKGLLISGLVVLLLILVAVGAALFYIRSGRINTRIVSEVQTALTQYGLRAEVGGLDIAWGLRTGKVHDVKIYNAQTNQLIATVDQAELVLEIPNPFALRLQREVIFKTLHLDNLQAYVELDEQGNSNFQGIHAPPPSAPSRITFDFASLVASIDGGTVHLNDRAHKIAGDLGKLKVNASPISGESKINLQFNAGDGRVNYEGRETTLEALELTGRLSDAGAEIDRLSFRSPTGDINVNGRVEDFNTLRYNFDVETQLVLDEAHRVFLPDTPLQGTAAFNGNINGEGKHYKINGRLSSDDLTASGARVRGVNVEEVNVEGDGERITFSSTQATANSVVAQKNQVSNITARGLQGTIINGHTEANLQQVNIARIALPQGQLAGIALRNIKANVEGEHTEAQIQQVNAARLDINQGEISGIALSGVKANLQGERYQVTGGLNLNGGQVSGAQIGKTSGQLSANNTTVALNKFTSAVLGGTAAGDVSVQIAGNGASRLNANLTDVKTNQLFSLLEVKENPLTGNVNGQFNVTWPGTQFEIVSGTIKAQFSGETTKTASTIPVNGDVSVTAQSGAFNVEQLALSTPASQVTATGHLTRKGDSDLRFSLTSTDATELQTIAYSIPDIEKSLADYKPRLAGAFSFEGSVTGSITDPAIEGDLKAADVGMRDRTIGSLTGHVRFSPTDVAFENGTLAVIDGGTAKFSYAAPRAAVATDGRLDATLDRINVETLTAAAGLSSQQQFISGVLTGEAHLTGLPGSPTGTATVNLLDGTLAGQTADLATANLVFDGKTARLERSEIRLAQGQLVANGNYDLKTSDFQLQGNADNVDLAQLVASLNVSTAVTGIANGTFSARGNTNDIGELNVELKAQGQNVTVNGKDAGTLSLTAHTNPGGRVDVDLITGIAGKPQPLRASIELRRPGRPIDVQANLEDFDLVPLLNAFAPDLASSITGAVNGKLHVSGPIVNEAGETTINGLRGDLTFSTIALQVQGRAINIQTPLSVTLNGPQLVLSQTRITGQGIDLALGGTLGLDEGSKLNFALKGSANLDSIGQVSPDLFLGGTVAIDARLDGTVSDPRLAGEIQANNLSFTGIDLPVSIENGNGRVVLAGDKITLESFTARANEGTFSINGAVNLAQLQPKDWRFVATANNVDVLYQGAQALVNGNFELTGTPDGQLLSGNVSIPEGEYTTNLDLASLTGGGGSVGLSIGDGGATSGSSGAFGLPPINLDVHVEAPNTLLIRNQQVNTVASAALTVNGTIDDPSIVGRVGVEGGTIKLRSQRYEITTGTIDFPVGGATPVVNILTEGDVSGYHVYLGLQGQIDAMDITLRSDPDLPRSEILSLVATGKIESSTLGSEDILASGLGTAASLLSDEFISQPLQSLLGLSRFQIDPVLEPNDNPAARLTVGKQLTRDLAFTYSSNVGSEQDRSAILEYTLTNRFSALASYTQGGSATNGARTNSDLTLEVRGRRRFSLGFKQPPATASETTSAVAGTNLVPPRIERTPKPPADVVVNKPETVKVRQAKLDELLPVKQEGYSRALARLGERNLANYLQEQGYFFATVRSNCDPADCSGARVKLVYDVQAGQRYDLEEIRIEGTDEIGVSDVSANLQSKTASFFGSVPILKGLPLIGGLARGITSDDRIRRDRETIRSAMADLGYRRARVTAKTEPKPDSNDLTIIFTVEQGTRAMVGEVLFKGNSVFSSKELHDVIVVKEENPFSPSQAREARQNIRNLYSQQGFLETAAQYTITDLDNERVRLVYEITEGSRALIADINVTGQTKTREASIARFFDFKPGETLTPDKIRRTQRDLFATGAFSEVTVHTAPVDANEPEARHVTVQVTEAKPLLMVYGLGFSTDEGPRGLLQLTNTNLFGRVNTASVRLRASFREQLAQVQYTDPRILGSNWGATVSTFYDRNSNLQTFLQRRLVTGGRTVNDGPGFGINRFVAFLQAERKFSDVTSLRLRYSFETTKLFNVQDIPVEEIARNAQAVRLGQFSVGLTNDKRNSALNPTTGQLISIEHSLAARPFGGNEAFNKTYINYQRYKQLSKDTPVIRDSVLAFSGRLGLAAPYSIRGTGTNGAITEADRQLPISERFFSGGATTLRGFQFEQAGPQAILEPRNADELPTLVPLGGNALLVMNFELRYPLTNQLRLVPFYDVGNVFRRVNDMNFKNLSHSIGLGLRFNTPIGPIGVDYGYLLNPPSFTSAGGTLIRQPKGVIHIRFGQTF